MYWSMLLPLMLFVPPCPGFHAAKAVGLGQPADPSRGEPETNGYGHKSVRLHLHFIYHCLASHPWTRTAENFSAQSHSPSWVNGDINTVLHLALGLLHSTWSPCGLKIPGFSWRAPEQLSRVFLLIAWHQGYVVCAPRCGMRHCGGCLKMQRMVR